MEFSQYLAAFANALGETSLVFYGLLFVAVFVAVLGIAQLTAGPDRVARRMSAAGVGDLSATAGFGEADRPDSRLNGFLRAVSKYAPGERDDKALRQRMVQAGYFGRDAGAIYMGVRVFLAAMLPLMLVVTAPIVAPALGAGEVLFAAVLLAAVGLYLPSLVVARRVRLRQRAMQEGFPDALDMLVTCVEAGLGLDAAFSRVGAQMWRPHPVVAQHFALVGAELRAGSARTDAMRNMAQRVGLDDVNAFVTLLIQSEQLGSSISETLRTYAYEMRQKRMLRAEEKANRLPAQLTIPLVLFLMPCMMVVVLLPAIILVWRTFIPAIS